MMVMRQTKGSAPRATETSRRDRVPLRRRLCCLRHRDDDSLRITPSHESSSPARACPAVATRRPYARLRRTTD